MGVYTGGECSAFEAARGEGVVADQLVVHVGSVVPTPHWVDPVLGAVPGGRVYALTMDDVQTQVLTKEQRTQTVTDPRHGAAQRPALLFLRAAETRWTSGSNPRAVLTRASGSAPDD